MTGVSRARFHLTINCIGRHNVRPLRVYSLSNEYYEYYHAQKGTIIVDIQITNLQMFHLQFLVNYCLVILNKTKIEQPVCLTTVTNSFKYIDANQSESWMN